MKIEKSNDTPGLHRLYFEASFFKVGVLKSDIFFPFWTLQLLDFLHLWNVTLKLKSYLHIYSIQKLFTSIEIESSVNTVFKKQFKIMVTL